MLPCAPAQASSGAIRRALGKLERGVCCMCGVDCRSLVAMLQSIRHGSKEWQERRLALIAQRFPKCAPWPHVVQLHMCVCVFVCCVC